MTRFEFIRSRLLAAPLPTAAAVPLAIPFVLAPTLIRYAVDQVVTDTTFVAYFPFVLLSSLLLGWRGGVIVMMASALVANFLFMQPRFQLFAHAGDTLGASFFVVSSSLLVFVTDTLRRTLVELDRGVSREAGLNAELQHLNTELLHRVKNTLAVVQGLAVQTFRGSPASDSALRTFKGRLHALAQAQDVLTSGRWESCRLPDLALSALAPFNESGAVTVEGPVCALPEAACVPLVLALHELGTNAVKHGALSSLTGSVDLVWSLRDSSEGSTVTLAWTERDGPPVSPPTRKGLGSRLLRAQRGLEDVKLDYEASGVRCQITIGSN